MSALGGAFAVGLALIAEEVIVTSRGGAGAIAGAFGIAAKAVQHIADPTIPAIPNLADRKAPPPAPNYFPNAGRTSPAFTAPGAPGPQGYSLQNPAPGH